MACKICIKLFWIYNVLCSNLGCFLFGMYTFSNEDSYLKIHYDMDIIPEDTLPKYNSDVCKWHLFVSNITEDVFHVLKDTFTLDYTHTLIFQTQSDESNPPTAQPLQLPASATDDTLKGVFLFSIHKNVVHFYESFNYFLFCL